MIVTIQLGKLIISSPEVDNEVVLTINGQTETVDVNDLTLALTKLMYKGYTP